MCAFQCNALTVLAKNSGRHRARQKNTPMKREAVVAVLVSEGLALVSVSAPSTQMARNCFRQI